MIKLLVADDYPMIRNRIRNILAEEQDMEISCEAGNGKEIFEMLMLHEVDMIILDFNMGDMSGLDILEKLKTLYPGIPVLMLTALSEGMYARKTLKAGAAGFLSKESAQEELALAIRKISTEKILRY
jgi:two-component system, NarL family, invasion response regulator UvrY